MIAHPCTDMRYVCASFCSGHPCQHTCQQSPQRCRISHAAKFKTVSKWEAAAKTEESSEERREGTTTTNEEMSEMAMEEIVVVKGRQFFVTVSLISSSLSSSIITRQLAKSPGRPSLIRCKRAGHG
jgi:hypothetical protein